MDQHGEGTPQGAVVSPLLANIYLHYVFDLWVEVWRKKCARGDVIVVRYADRHRPRISMPGRTQIVSARASEATGEVRAGTTPRQDAPDRVWGYAEQNRKQRGEGKPETFDFLWVHAHQREERERDLCGASKTISKRLRAKLQEIKQQLRNACMIPWPQTGAWLRSVVQGYFNYHAVPGNLDSLGLFRERVLRYWGQALQRRSQIRRYAWVRRLKLAAQWLPDTSCAPSLAPLSLPSPVIRDPYALMSARTDLCGGDQQWSSLPRPHRLARVEKSQLRVPSGLRANRTLSD